MERPLKQRLVGATVLVALAVIFLPMLLQGPQERGFTDAPTIVPPEPRSRFASPEPPVPLPPAVAPPPEAEAPLEETPATVAEAAPPAAPQPQAQSQVQSQAQPSPSPRSAPQPPAASALTTWVVQLASFSEEANAVALRDRLRKLGHSAYVEGPAEHGGRLYRVRVGPLQGYDEAVRLRERFAERMRLKGMVIRHQPQG